MMIFSPVHMSQGCQDYIARQLKPLTSTPRSTHVANKMQKVLTVFADSHSRFAEDASQAVGTVQPGAVAPSPHLPLPSAPLPLHFRTHSAAAAAVHVLQALVAGDGRTSGPVARRTTPERRRREGERSRREEKDAD